MKLPFAVVFTALCTAMPLYAQAPAEQIRQERSQAELEIPKLVESLALRPSMVVADVGAGGGAMTVVLAR